MLVIAHRGISIRHVLNSVQYTLFFCLFKEFAKIIRRPNKREEEKQIPIDAARVHSVAVPVTVPDWIRSPLSYQSTSAKVIRNQLHTMRTQALKFRNAVSRILSKGEFCVAFIVWTSYNCTGSLYKLYLFVEVRRASDSSSAKDVS